MRYVVALVSALVLNAVANLMMKFGAMRMRSTPLDWNHGLGPLMSSLMHHWVLLLGLCFFAANVFLYTYALSRVPISVAYPIMVSGGFAIIAIVAAICFSESLSRWQMGGIVLILLGVYFVAREMKLQS